jgi:ribosome assembly protein 1
VTVLRQVWADGIKPVLVINKMDRLMTELKQQPIEAYHHLTRLLEKVNAVIGGFYASERMEQDYKWRENLERKLEARRDAAAASSLDASGVEDEELFKDEDDEDLYFSPDKGNVIFASAMDGWGFRVGNFARIFATRLGTKETVLRRVLWGDYYIEPKTKRIIGQKHLRGRNLKPLFVQLVLENLWAIYENVLTKL